MCLYFLELKTIIRPNTICISSKIKELTGWSLNYHNIEDVIIFFKTRYPTEDGRLNLYGVSGENLRTLSPKDYFTLVGYEREMKTN